MTVARRLAAAVALRLALLGTVLVLVACTGEPVGAGAAPLGDPRGARGDGTYVTPEIKSTPDIVVVQDSPYTAYNNHPPTGPTLANTVVLNQVLSDPFVPGGNLEYLRNGDVMQSAELTSENPQVVTYRIKPGVLWSDGQPWDCDDFYLSWLARSAGASADGSGARAPVPVATGTPSSVTPTSTTGVDSATGQCRDDLTFVETYQRPYADWASNYANNSILPAHILEQQTGIVDITSLGRAPSPELGRVLTFWNGGWLGFNAPLMPGSGPYLIESWQPGVAVTLARNPRWTGNPGGPIRIVLRAVPPGAPQTADLAAGALAVLGGADPATAEQLRGLTREGVALGVRPGLALEHLDLNLAHPLMADEAVRQAFAECIDRFALVDQLLRGVSPDTAPLGSLLTRPDQPGYEDVFSARMPASAETAKRTLEAAGWILGPDGVYSKDGQRLSFPISNSGLALERRVAALVAEQCRAAGMEITDGADPGFLQRGLLRADYAVALFAWNSQPQRSAFASVYGSAGRQNYRGYTNPVVDEAWTTVTTEFDDDVRAEALRSIDRAIAEDYASLPLFTVPSIWAHNDAILHVSGASYDGVTWNANEWETR